MRNLLLLSLLFIMSCSTHTEKNKTQTVKEETTAEYAKPDTISDEDTFVGTVTDTTDYSCLYGANDF